jgi:DNA-binding transcriptional regulator YbjK
VTTSSILQAPKSTETIAAILHATLLVIAEGGIDAVTHRRVAARAGVSLSSTTYHFSNRNELIARAFEHYIEQVRVSINQLDQHRPRNLGEVVDAVLSHAQWEFADEALVRAEYELILYSTRNDEVRELFLAWRRDEELRIAEGLEELGVAKPLRSARMLASTVRAFELERLSRGDVSFEELRERIELVVRALETR